MCTNILLICVLSLAASLVCTERVEITPACQEEFTQQRELRDQCHGRLPNAGQNIFADFNATMLDFSGNAEDFPVVEAFFTKYCEIIPSFLKCFELSDDVSAECKLQMRNRLLILAFFEATSLLVRYSCDNDADMLKRLVPHDGLKFLLLNDSFDRCFVAFKNLETLNDLCLAIDNATPCFEETVGDHANKDIMVFMLEIINHFKSSANC